MIFERHFFAICTFFSGAGTKGVLCVCVVHKQRGVRKEGSQQCGGVRSKEKLKAACGKKWKQEKVIPPPPSLIPPYTQLQPPGKEEKKLQCFAAWNKSGCRVVAKCTATTTSITTPIRTWMIWSRKLVLHCCLFHILHDPQKKRLQHCWNRVSFCLTHTKWVDWYTMTIVVSQLYRDFFPQFPSWDICYQKLLFYR